MRDHEAVDLAAVSVDGLGKLEPHVVGHVLRTDLNNLLGSNHSDVSKLRNSGNQMVDANLTGRVGGTRCRIAGTGNRAARGEHFDLRQRGSHGGTASGSDSSGKQRLLKQAHFCFSLSKKCFGKYSHACEHRQSPVANRGHMKFIQFRFELLTNVSYAKLLSESKARNLLRFVKSVSVLDRNQKCKFPY